MAGNTIYMQEGSNYIDIHDNEVVNLNIDKATVSIQENAEVAEGESDYFINSNDTLPHFSSIMMSGGER